MRHDKAQGLLKLARALAGSAEGLTLDEMADVAGVGRRTAERMRDALVELFPALEIVDDPPTKRFRIPSGLDGLFQAPTAEELVVLGGTVEGLKAEGHHARAAALASLEAKLKASIRSSALRRLAPDFEALMHAETVAVQAGPRPFEDETVLATIRHAVKAMQGLSFKYAGGSSPGRVRQVAPYGLMFGRANYLVAADLGQSEPRTWRLDRMSELQVLDTPAAPPPGFSLQAFAGRSFGIYQDAVEDVVLHILPHGAEDARGWRFHPSQTVEDQADGSVVVRFRSSGMRELAWHLFTWGDKVRIVGPERLREVMRGELDAAIRATSEAFQPRD